MRLLVEIESTDDEATVQPQKLAMDSLFSIRGKIAQGDKDGIVRDINGNKIGRWEFSK